MKSRSFGNTPFEVSIIGYGSMPLSLAGRPDEREAVRVLHGVWDLGVTFIDTADTYCLSAAELHHNERLLALALSEYPRETSAIRIATKGGTIRTAAGWEFDGHPGRLYDSLCGSFEALGGERPIFLWQHHWPDPAYSIAESLGPIRRAVEAGLVRYVGVGNYTVDQIRQARDVLEVVSVQNQFNLWHRGPETRAVLEYCERENLVFLPWRPMGGLGLAEQLHQIEPLTRLADEKQVSPHRLLIAWQLASSPSILPIPGTRHLAHFQDCLAALELELAPDDLAAIDAIRPEQLPRRKRPVV